MRRIDTHDPNQLAYQGGGGCLSLFGLPFFAAGVFVMFAALTGQMKTKGGQPGGIETIIFGTVFGLIFASVGAGFLFGRSGLVFDKGTKTVKRWYGLLFPMWARTYEVNSFNEVTISKEVRRSKKSTYTVYPVRLTGRNVSQLDICEPRDEQEARRIGEEVAKFINVDMVSGLGGVTVRREAGTLDESLRERLRRSGQDVDITAPPDGMRSRFSARGNAVFFQVPPPPFSVAHVAPIGCAAVFAGFVGFTFLAPLLTDTRTPTEVKLIFGVFVGGIFMLLPLASTIGMAVARLKRRCQVEADSYSLRVTMQGAVSSKSFEVPSKELEELRIEENRGEYCLAAVSDKQTVRFAEGLPRAELEWIRDVMLKALAA